MVDREGGTVIRIRNYFADVVASIDTVNTRHPSSGARVDQLDAAVRHRAAENLGVQHAGYLHEMGVFGAPSHLLAGFKAGQRAADLAAGRYGCGHQLCPPLTCMAARTARAE